MTLGNVYDMDLKKNEALIKEVIIQAQGEVGLPTGNALLLVLTLYLDGVGRIYQDGQGNLVQLYPRPCQLPEQMQANQVRLQGILWNH
jgi:hypothetical protein